MQFDTTTTSSWKFGHRGRVAVFIDGNNLFHAARFHNIDIDYNKLLRILLGDGRLLRAFFYTGVDAGAERQQGFLLWMRRNGFRVVRMLVCVRRTAGRLPVPAQLVEDSRRFRAERRREKFGDSPPHPTASVSIRSGNSVLRAGASTGRCQRATYRRHSDSRLRRFAQHGG